MRAERVFQILCLPVDVLYVGGRYMLWVHVLVQEWAGLDSPLRPEGMWSRICLIRRDGWGRFR